MDDETYDTEDRWSDPDTNDGIVWADEGDES